MGLTYNGVVPLDTFTGVGVSHTYPDAQVVAQVGADPTTSVRTDLQSAAVADLLLSHI